MSQCSYTVSATTTLSSTLPLSASKPSSALIFLTISLSSAHFEILKCTCHQSDFDGEQNYNYTTCRTTNRFGSDLSISSGFFGCWTTNALFAKEIMETISTVWFKFVSTLFLASKLTIKFLLFDSNLDDLDVEIMKKNLATTSALWCHQNLSFNILHSKSLA